MGTNVMKLNRIGKKLNPQKIYNELLLENSPDIVFLFDADLHLLTSSKESQLYLRSPRENLAGISLEDIFSRDIPKEWVDRVAGQHRLAYAKFIPVQYDDIIFSPERGLIDVRISINPVADDDGHPVGTVMALADITELVKAKQKAEEAALSKSNFLANMSHEIRTPMNAVKGLSELLALTELTSLQRNYVSNIINSSNSLLGIINDVLDFAKIDAKKIELVETEYSPAELIDSVCSVVSMKAEEKGLLLLVDADPGMPSLLRGDDIRIKQIMTNILSNAVKYTKEGSILLKFNMTGGRDQPRLFCSVEDTGMGIQERDIPLLFNAFSRVDLHTNRSILGTGLGLSISRQLAHAMGGEIMVKSVYGQGSTFSFEIPQEIVSDTPMALVQDKNNKRVLLLESGIYREHLSGMLTSLGVSFETENFDPGMDLSRFTHCIYNDADFGHFIPGLKEKYPDCRFAVLKSLRYIMSLNQYQDSVLYAPFQVVHLASFLNKNSAVQEESSIHPDSMNTEAMALRDVKILVVDDNAINLTVGREMLQAFNAVVDEAEGGQQALDMCGTSVYDIIFMDHMMPGMDGIIATRLIRTGNGPNRATPIVALTANVVSGIKDKYLAEGMNDFIGKPVEMSDLRRVLTRWLPAEKLGFQEKYRLSHNQETPEDQMTPEILISALDNFGMYSSDVLREMDGDFEGYISRMDAASRILGALTDRLKKEVIQRNKWEDFEQDMLDLRRTLHGVGARDCANRARVMASAAHDGNIQLIDDDFNSLMGNMYMLEKKLFVIVPLARGGSLKEHPLNVSHYLHGCLEKMRKALESGNREASMILLNEAASYSLNKDLDMSLKEIKADLESGNFEDAQKHLSMAMQQYAGADQSV